MKITAVIPARLGSSRVKEKVLLPYANGETLLSWKIKQLQKVLPNEEIYVSSESNKILSVAKDLGVMTHIRDPYLSDGHKATFSEVIYGIIKDIPAEHIAWCTVVCPLTNEKHFAECFQKYKEIINENVFDSLVAVTEAKDYYWDKKGPLNYKATKHHTISQELPDWYKVTNSLYMASKNIILSEKYILGKNPYLNVLPKIAGVDIDDWFDYQVALSMFNANKENYDEF